MPMPRWRPITPRGQTAQQPATGAAGASGARRSRRSHRRRCSATSSSSPPAASPRRAASWATSRPWKNGVSSALPKLIDDWLILYERRTQMPLRRHSNFARSAVFLEGEPPRFPPAQVGTGGAKNVPPHHTHPMECHCTLRSDFTSTLTGALVLVRTTLQYGPKSDGKTHAHTPNTRISISIIECSKRAQKLPVEKDELIERSSL